MSEGDLLPEGAVPPPVDLIQPVPAPEIAFGEISTGPALPENLKIDNQGGTIAGNLEDGIRLGGPVKVEGDNGLEIFSDRARVDLKEKSVTFDGNVSVYQSNVLQRGQTAVYFYETRTLDASGLRASLDPILAGVRKIHGNNRRRRAGLCRRKRRASPPTMSRSRTSGCARTRQRSIRETG